MYQITPAKVSIVDNCKKPVSFKNIKIHIRVDTTSKILGKNRCVRAFGFMNETNNRTKKTTKLSTEA